jgi:4'-phosphopantetheinyl transferase
VSFSLAWPTAEIPRELAPEQIHVWAWPLDGPLETAQLALLDEEELSRFHRFHFERDRTHFAIAHANMRRLLGAYLNQAPERLSFRVSRFGKPELAAEGLTPPVPFNVRFNLSHSRSLALLAVAAEIEVGVDIEEIQPIEPEVAESHFSAAELSALASLNGDAWLQGFYRCWTRKEAILKGEGVGLNVPLDSFDVSLVPGMPAKVLGARPAAAFRHRWTLHNLATSPGMAAALAVGSSRAEVFCFRLK